MFKKIKDFAEEVKSSPQKFQQMAQAAQAVVTQASSSISDMKNNDMFSIGGDDTPSSSLANRAGGNSLNNFQDVSLSQSPSPQSGLRKERETTPIQTQLDNSEKNRSRRLSTSSIASDVSFRLPNYESPQSLYHLQSDMDVSASEAEDRGFSPGAMNLERVSKEQLYQAYRRTQERYTKYRTRYADLARHYRLLERENSKARAVLVETQDKALRRISELREQCALEQSAKAHLEHALRLELDEKNLKIETLTTKINLLQSDESQSKEILERVSNIPNNAENQNEISPINQNLIDLSSDTEKNKVEDSATSAYHMLNNKIEKLEQLVSKYKETHKTLKEKNSSLDEEFRKQAKELEKFVKENEKLRAGADQLSDATQQILELRESNKIMENKLHELQSNQDVHNNVLLSDLESAKTQMLEMEREIEGLKKREEENAISLAENKLSIHKELESKETEIKFLKTSLETMTKEIKSVEIVGETYKEELEKSKQIILELKNKLAANEKFENALKDLENEIIEFKNTICSKDQSYSKLLEQYKCLELEHKSEKAEKMAMIDRNKYLESRNSSIQEENSKKNTQIAALEREMSDLNHKLADSQNIDNDAQDEIVIWKQKYGQLEQEIKEEREEFVKLRDEIEKMMQGTEVMKLENESLHKEIKFQVDTIENLTSKLSKLASVQTVALKLKQDTEMIRTDLSDLASSIKSFAEFNNEELKNTVTQVLVIFKQNSFGNNKGNKDSENLLPGSKNNAEDSSISELELKKLTIEADNLKQANDSLSDLQKQSKDIITKLEDELKEFRTLKLDFDSLRQEKYELEIKINRLEEEKRELKNNADIIMKERSILQSDLEKNNLTHQTLLEEKKSFEHLDEEKNEELEKLRSQLLGISEEKDKMFEDFSNLKKVLEEKNLQMEDKVLMISELEEKLKQITRECGTVKDKSELLKQEKEELHEKCLLLDQKAISAKKTLDETIALSSVQSEKIEKLEQQIRDVSAKEGSCKIDIEKSEERLRFIENEKLKLIEEVSSLSTDKESLKLKIDEVNTDNEKLRSEMENLNKCMEMDNKKIAETSSALHQSKAEAVRLLAEIASLKKLDKEINELKSDNEKLRAGLEFQQVTFTKLETDHKDIQNRYQSLRDDNAQLKGEIEELQEHIVKISNENSELNSKIRNLLANETVVKSSKKELQSTPSEHEHLRKIIEDNKEHISDLERQNTILVEEKLELEDQLRFLTKGNGNNNITAVNDTELELTRVREKNRELTEDKMLLESRLADLELMGRSGADNLRQLEINNEKLRLSKEKVEQSLDEALVSLRHARALQESTELEYLRNILYEYLTGPSSHALTLAKVLSAVVKFDDRQTELVLQKEKERQGMLATILQI